VPAAGGTTGHKLLTSTGAPASLSETVSKQASDEVSFAFTADAGQISDWGTGSYNVELNVTFAGSQVFGYKAQLVRVDSACNVVATLATSASQSGTGLKTFTFNGVSSTGSISDRLQARILSTAGNGGGTARTLTIQVNTNNSEVAVPWVTG
jgi:hypothetical protein